MSWRTVVISNNSKLDYQMGCMIVRTDQIRKVFLDEIGTLILESTAISLTTYLINELLKRKINVIFCDEKRNPNAVLTALYGSHDTSRKVHLQTAFSQEIRGRVWQQIIIEKILNQTKLLEFGQKSTVEQLSIYASEVEFGDETNREGHAAKVYFNSLFGKDFSRSQSSNLNAALNYGYSLLLSRVNREIVSNGFITQLGLFHGNKFNPYNLGSDLMEPFRPIIDYLVFKNQIEEFSKEEKRMLLTLFDFPVKINDRKERFTNALSIYVKSVFDSLQSESIEYLRFPEINFTES